MSTVPVVIIDATGRCNLRCVHCWNAGYLSYELSRDTIIRIIDSAPEKARIHFLGGEPLLHPSIVDLVGYAVHRGHYTSLVTNGTRLTDVLRQRLLASGISEIAVSLDGPDASTHDHVRGRGVFEKAWSSFVTLANAVQQQSLSTVLSVSITAMRPNTPAIPMLVERIGRSGLFVDNIIIDRVVAEGRAATGDEILAVDPEAWLDAMEHACRAFRGHPRLQSITIKGPPRVHEYLTLTSGVFLQDSIIGCPALLTPAGARVCSDGRVFSCARDGLITRAMRRGYLSSQGENVCRLLDRGANPYVNEEFRATLGPLLSRPEGELCDHCDWQDACIECPIVRLLDAEQVNGELAHGSSRLCAAVVRRLDGESGRRIHDSSLVDGPREMGDKFELSPEVYYRERRDGSICFVSVLLDKSLSFPAGFQAETFAGAAIAGLPWVDAVAFYAQSTGNSPSLGEYVAGHLRQGGFTVTADRAGANR